MEHIFNTLSNASKPFQEIYWTFDPEKIEYRYQGRWYYILTNGDKYTLWWAEEILLEGSAQEVLDFIMV